MCSSVPSALAKAATTTTLTVTSGGTTTSSVTSGTAVTLTATVTAGVTAVTPGQVNFCDASASFCTDVHLLGTAQLTSAGTATLKFRPGIGNHSYKAVFLGTNAYSGSASNGSSLAVTGSIGPFASTTTIAETGSWGTYALSATVTEVGGTAAPTGTVSFLDASNGNAVEGTASLGVATPGISFVPSQSSAASSYPGSAAVIGDFNGDGIPDMAALNQGTGVVIYLGNGDGTLTGQPVTFGTGSYPEGIVAADFNDDGIQDLAVVNNSGNNVTILLGNGNGTFTATTTSPSVGTSPTGITVGDFNGDGIADLAVTNSNNNSGPGSVTILLGNGDGSFAAVSTTPATSTSPGALTSGDFNHDGFADLAITNQNDYSLTILLGNGDGTFTAAASPAVTSGAQAIAVVDLNGDGVLDLVVGCNNGGLIKVLLGNGDGTFTAAPAFPASLNSPVGVAIADFNQDGIPDTAILSNYTNGGVQVFLGKGDGTFSSTPIIPIWSLSPEAFGVGDFNQDGRPDVVVSSQSGDKFLVYVTRPTQTATASGNILLSNAGLHNVNASYAGDSNYNASVSGTTPLWGAPPSTSTTLSLTANGSPATSVVPDTVVTLTATVTSGGTPVTHGQVNFCNASAVACSDINLVGSSALTSGGTAALKFVPGPGTHSYKAVFVENGYGLTSASSITTLTVTPAKAPVYSDTAAIAYGGVAGNYSLSATIVGYGGSAPPTGTISFLDTSFGNTSLATASLGTSTAGFGWLISQTPTLSNVPVCEVVGDFDGDGITDIALLWAGSSGPGGLTIYFGNGNGTFRTGPTTQASVAVSPASLDMVSGDFNGDGKLDVALLSYQYNNVDYVTTFLGNGDGTFSVSPKSQVFNQGVVGGDVISGSMVAGDFNGDGKLDLAVAGDYVSEGGVTIVLGNGDGTFTAGTPNLAPDQGLQQIATADFNGDGIPDLVAASYFGPGSATVFLGKGDGSFTVLPTQLALEPFPKSIVAGDFNGDGKPDLAFAFTTDVMVFLGNGDGTFTQPQTSHLPNGGSIVSLIAGDFNKDGKADLAALDSYWGQLEIFIGAGDGTFTATTTTPSLLPNWTTPLFITASDFNGDGVPDLVMLDRYVKAAGILISQPTETATATVTGIAPVGAGTHNVEASYSGDSNYGTAVSSTVSLTAGMAPLVFSPAPGVYSTTQTVTISEPIPGATIYYQAYGTYNTNGFVPYTGPIPLTNGGTETITAYATETGYQQSNYQTVTYSLNLPAAPAPTISPAAGSFSGSQMVTITDAAPGATIYYTTNGGSPTTSSAVYTGPITVSSSGTVAAIATANGYGTSSVAYAQYFISSAQSAFVYTIAGNGVQGYSGDSGLATVASLNFPTATAVDGQGNVYISDSGNNLVRKLTAGTGIITTVAGTGTAGYSGDNGPAISAQLFGPGALALDGAGNLYIADSLNRVIRRVSADTGTITTYAGSSTATSLGDGGPATSALLPAPNGLAFDSAGNLYISDSYRIREVNTSTGTITTVAGNGNFGYSGDNGPATSASFESAQGIAFDGNGNLYIADSYNNAIRKVTTATGVISTVAGSSYGYGGDGGPALSARLNHPNSVAFDAAGNLYIADLWNNAIREVAAADGTINTIMGHPPYDCLGIVGDGGIAANSAVCEPEGLTFDGSGNLLVAESGTSRIRKITTVTSSSTVTTATPVFDISAGTYAGPQTVHLTDATPGAKIYVTVDGSTPGSVSSGYQGSVNVTGSATVQAIAIAPGYLPSAPAAAVYTITAPATSVMSTVAGNGVSGNAGAGQAAATAELAGPNAVAFDRYGNVYIADTNNHAIWKVDAVTGILTVAAGTPGMSGESGDGGPATSATLYGPSDIALDTAGNLYIADTQNNVVRKVAADTGIISVYAGSRYFGALGDGGPATSASLYLPQGLAFDSAGNLYIADTIHFRVRMVSASTGIINTVAGTGNTRPTGDGGRAVSAGLAYPTSLVVDPLGNLYIADRGRVRFVNATSGVITTIAGNGNYGESGDGGSPTSAELYVDGLALDKSGNLYISNWPGIVRMVPAGGGTISTIAGNPYRISGGDGGPATMAGLSNPAGLAFDSASNLYITDSYDHRVRQVTFNGLPHVVSFGNQWSNTTLSSSFMYWNHTTAPLAITKISVSGNFTQTNDCPSTLNVGTACTITVFSSPASIGQQSGTVEIDDSSPNSPYIVPILVNTTLTAVAPSRPDRSSRSSTSNAATTNLTSTPALAGGRHFSRSSLKSQGTAWKNDASPRNIAIRPSAAPGPKSNGNYSPLPVEAVSVISAPKANVRQATESPLNEPNGTFEVQGPTILALLSPLREVRQHSGDKIVPGELRRSDVEGVARQLRTRGIMFREFSAGRLSLRVRGTSTTIEPSEDRVAYYFITPGKAPRIEYGPLSQADLMKMSDEYFGSTKK